MSTIISALEWRYATKQSATSYGLQPFRVLVITDKETKEKLRAAAFNQPQLTTASHIFVFAAKQDVAPEYIDGFIQMLADQRGIPFEAVTSLKNGAKNKRTSPLAPC